MDSGEEIRGSRDRSRPGRHTLLAVSGGASWGFPLVGLGHWVSAHLQETIAGAALGFEVFDVLPETSALSRVLNPGSVTCNGEQLTWRTHHTCSVIRVGSARRRDTS